MKDKNYIVTMSDGSKWAIHMKVIARSCAEHYAKDEKYKGDVKKCLEEEVWPFFEGDSLEVAGWARNHMRWSDVKGHAKMIHPPDVPDYQDDWANNAGEVE